MKLKRKREVKLHENSREAPDQRYVLGMEGINELFPSGKVKSVGD
jgi:hypothetical protein